MIWLDYILFTCLCWLLAVTVGFPLTLVLLFSNSFRSSFAAWSYSRIFEPLFRKHITVARKKAFQMLKEKLKSMSGHLEILEIGAGPGPNLQFYPENCSLTVLNQREGYQPYFLKNLKKYSHISYRRTVVQPAENMAGIVDGSFDVVISTYLHCSTDDSNAALREIKRVLKPGGKYLFLDHVGFPKGEIGLFTQKFMGPLWALYSDGCILHRDVTTSIKGAGFSDVTCEKLTFNNFFMYFLRHQIHIDVARKRAFQILKENLNTKSGMLEVLEIGVGQGPNLQFYPENCSLTVLNQSEGYQPCFLKNLKKHSHICYLRTVIQPAENMSDINDESFDVVISTYLHCSTENPNTVVQEVKLVLKPGGKYLFLNHVGFPAGDFGLCIQKFMSLLWTLYSDGCVMLRDIATTIEAAGFSDIT